MVNELFKYGGCEVRAKLLKIMIMLFEKREETSNFRKALMKPIFKKEDKSNCE